MITVHIPGKGSLHLQILVLDFNGTVALDGVIFETVKNYIIELSSLLDIHILTADTFGTVARQCQGLPVQINVLKSSDHTSEKGNYLSQFNLKEVVAVGNGSNDRLMLERANLSIAVIGFEGASVRALQAADIVVHRIEDALGLLLKPNRLKATLRS